MLKAKMGWGGGGMGGDRLQQNSETLHSPSDT